MLWLRRVGWFVIIWCLGVATVALVAFAIHALLPYGS